MDDRNQEQMKHAGRAPFKFSPIFLNRKTFSHTYTRKAFTTQQVVREHITEPC